MLLEQEEKGLNINQASNPGKTCGSELLLSVSTIEN
jgi:hypothetical protein